VNVCVYDRCLRMSCMCGMVCVCVCVCVCARARVCVCGDGGNFRLSSSKCHLPLSKFPHLHCI